MQASAPAPARVASTTRAPRCPACLEPLTAALDHAPAMRTCSSCRTASFWPQPSAAGLEAYYNSDYSVADAGLTPRRRENWHPLINAASRHTHGRHGLEIGASTGAFLRLAAANGWRMGGVELDGHAREQAARHAPDIPVWPSLAVASAEAGAAWDAVWLLHTLEHLAEPEPTLREVLAALRPDGVVVVTTPNGDSLQRRLLGPLWEWWTPPAHLSLFSPLGLRALLERVGFEVLSLETRRGDSTGTAANLLLAPARWLRRRGGSGQRQRSSARAASQRLAALINAVYDPLSWPLRRRLYRDLYGPELCVVARRRGGGMS